MAGGDNGMIVNIAISLKMLSMRVVKFGWELLDFCYLSDQLVEDCLPIPAVTKIFPAKVEDPFIRADILIQTLREINGVLLYTEENLNRGTFLQSLEKNYHIMSRLQSLQNSGWIVIDDEQLTYLSGIMVSTQKNIVKEPPVVSTSCQSDKVMDEDAAIIESKISQIKDLFPDFGKGFLAACLEVYNQNPEEVIQRILEGTLHEDLQCLNTSLEEIPLPKSTTTLSRKDKGKGKLVESTPLLPAANQVPERQATTNPSVSSSSTIGRFVRKPNDASDQYTLDTKDEKDRARITSLISQYEYEDEYDDSFDDLGFSVAESGFEENETLSERLNSNSGKSFGVKADSSPQTASNTKWGSKRKPQYYVKDGKNYSYRVEGSVAVANANDASLITQAQKAQGELIYGLGRGGNLASGAINTMAEYQEQELSNESETGGRGQTRNQRGKGRKGRGGKVTESSTEQENSSDASEIGRREIMGNARGTGRGGRGRGRGAGGYQEEQEKQSEAEVERSGSQGNTGGRGWGRGNNHFRKNRAMNKHFAGVSGF